MSSHHGTRLQGAIIHSCLLQPIIQPQFPCMQLAGVFALGHGNSGFNWGNAQLALGAAAHDHEIMRDSASCSVTMLVALPTSEGVHVLRVYVETYIQIMTCAPCGKHRGENCRAADGCLLRIKRGRVHAFFRQLRLKITGAGWLLSLAQHTGLA